MNDLVKNVKLLNIFLEKNIKKITINEYEAYIDFYLDDKIVRIYSNRDLGYADIQIDGDIENLINSKLLMSEIISGKSYDEQEQGVAIEWVFIKFATIKGYVTIQFHNSSDYCSEYIYYSMDVTVKVINYEEV